MPLVEVETNTFDFLQECRPIKELKRLPEFFDYLVPIGEEATNNIFILM